MASRVLANSWFDNSLLVDVISEIILMIIPPVCVQ